MHDMSLQVIFLVKNQTGKSENLKVECTTSVAKLREEVKKSQLHFLEDEPFLIFAREILLDDRMLKQYHIKEGSVIDVA